MTQLITAIKIDSFNSFAECAKIIRQFQSCSFTELKKRIDNHEYVLCYDCSDDIGLKKIIRCYEKLCMIGVTASLYELDDRPTTIELLRNRDRMYDEISEEIDSED